jgi:hypothetical protein
LLAAERTISQPASDATIVGISSPRLRCMNESWLTAAAAA